VRAEAAPWATPDARGKEKKFDEGSSSSSDDLEIEEIDWSKIKPPLRFRGVKKTKK
jgi:hypothetical protein